MARQRPRGRRPGNEDTAEAILLAARAAFAERGYDGTSIRRIAATAGVDSALVHHYFGTKEQLFVAAVRFPIDPAELASRIGDGSADRLGERIVATFLSVWDDPTSGPALEALMRGALASQDAARLMQEFFAVEIVRRLAPTLVSVVDPDQLATRASLVASQLFGLAAVRHLLRFEPLASMSSDDAVAAVAPTIQRYLTGTWTVDGDPAG